MSRPGDTPPVALEPEPTTPERRVGRLLVLTLLALGLVAVAIAAAVLSFGTLERFAVLVAYPEDRAGLFPWCLDVAAAVAAVAWLGGRWLGAPNAVPFARFLCLSTLGTSVVATGVGHGLEAAGVTRPHLAIVLVAAAVPALALGGAVHLVALVVRDLVGGVDDEDEEGRDESDEDETPRPDSSWTDEALVADLRRWAADPSRPTPSRDRVVDAYGVGAKRAKALREAAGVGGDLVDMRPVGSAPTAVGGA